MFLIYVQKDNKLLGVNSIDQNEAILVPYREDLPVLERSNKINQKKIKELLSGQGAETF